MTSASFFTSLSFRFFICKIDTHVPNANDCPEDDIEGGKNEGSLTQARAQEMVAIMLMMGTHDPDSQGGRARL